MGVGSPITLTTTTERLKYGPSWRFDHTMVVAPSVRRYRREDLNALVLYGGGGGADIFNDIWSYDPISRTWNELEVQNEEVAATSIITSLLFGTVGFAIYTCIIVCIFMRKLARSRRQLGQLADAEQGGAMQSGRQARRGIPQEAIDALPRLQWSAARECAEQLSGAGHRPEGAADAVEQPAGAAHPPERTTDVGSSTESGDGDPKPAGEDLTVEDCNSSVASDAPGAVEIEMKTVESTPAGKGEDEDGEGELCSVCLCDYDDNDVLIRLPCGHLFHEACITRWLRQDSSCPHCRYNLLPARHSGGSTTRRGSRNGSSPALPMPAPQDIQEVNPRQVESTGDGGGGEEEAAAISSGDDAPEAQATAVAADAVAAAPAPATGEPEA